MFTCMLSFRGSPARDWAEISWSLTWLSRAAVSEYIRLQPWNGHDVLSSPEVDRRDWIQWREMHRPRDREDSACSAPGDEHASSRRLAWSNRRRAARADARSGTGELRACRRSLSQSTNLRSQCRGPAACWWRRKTSFRTEQLISAATTIEEEQKKSTTRARMQCDQNCTYTSVFPFIQLTFET